MKTKSRKAYLTVVAATVFASWIFLSGCNAAQRAAFQEQLITANSVLAGASQGLEDARATGDPELIAEAQKVFDDARGQVKLVIERTENADSGAAWVGGVLGGIAPTLPPPWNLVALAVTGGLAGYGERKRRQVKAATNAIEAIEQTKEGGVVDFESNAPALRNRMTPQARKFVRQARGKVSS